jgi:hypothetical protein
MQLTDTTFERAMRCAEQLRISFFTYTKRKGFFAWLNPMHVNSRNARLTRNFSEQLQQLQSLLVISKEKNDYNKSVYFETGIKSPFPDPGRAVYFDEDLLIRFLTTIKVVRQSVLDHYRGTQIPIETITQVENFNDLIRDGERALMYMGAAARLKLKEKPEGFVPNDDQLR